MSLLTIATAVEDRCFEAVQKVEDAMLHAARTLALVPTPAEMAKHTFDFVDRLVANLQEFTSQLVALAPSEAESRPTPAKAVAKAHAA